MTTDQKGAIVEMAIALKATLLGVHVFRPTAEGGRYDLIFDLDPKLVRVQCKWASRYGDVIMIAAITAFVPTAAADSVYADQYQDADGDGGGAGPIGWTTCRMVQHISGGGSTINFSGTISCNHPIWLSVQTRLYRYGQIVASGPVQNCAACNIVGSAGSFNSATNGTPFVYLMDASLTLPYGGWWEVYSHTYCVATGEALGCDIQIPFTHHS